MNPWTCAALIVVSGGIGGVLNALLTVNGFALPRLKMHVWCPGFISNVLVGAFSAFASWAFYGSGASIDLAQQSARAVLSLKFSALAGAFMVGVAGARWLTNEADKRMLKEGVKLAGQKELTKADCEDLTNKSPRQMLDALEVA